MVAGARRMTPELMRGLGELDATMIVVGVLIGSGIFIVSAESSRLVGAPGVAAGRVGLGRAHDDHRLPVLR